LDGVGETVLREAEKISGTAQRLEFGNPVLGCQAFWFEEVAKLEKLACAIVDAGAHLGVEESRESRFIVRADSLQPRLDERGADGGFRVSRQDASCQQHRNQGQPIDTSEGKETHG
jgi:hypothetical protein